MTQVKQSPVNPGRFMVLGIGESGGVLWVIGAMPDARWTERIEGPLPDVPGHLVVDGVLEARDPETLELRTSRRFDYVFLHGGFVPGTEFLVQLVEDEMGAYRFVIVRPRFSPHRSSVHFSWRSR